MPGVVSGHSRPRQGCTDTTLQIHSLRYCETRESDSGSLFLTLRFSRLLTPRPPLITYTYHFLCAGLRRMGRDPRHLSFGDGRFAGWARDSLPIGITLDTRSSPHDTTQPTDMFSLFGCFTIMIWNFWISVILFFSTTHNVMVFIDW